MRAIAKAMPYRPNASDRHYDQAVRTVLAIAGAMFSLAGVLLAVGGYLSAFNGSAFHILAGLGLIVSGALVARRHPAGAWTYMLVFAGTVSWALSNVEDGSILAFRLIGPLLLLLMIAVLMPLLYRWRPGRTFAVFTVLVAATVALGIMSLPDGPLGTHTAAVTHFLDAETKGVLR